MKHARKQREAGEDVEGLSMGSETAKAVGLVNGDRMADYGHPLDNHTRIADFWTTRLGDKLRPGVRIEPHEAAAMMRLVKEARLMQTPGHEDSLVDISGYVEVERMIHDETVRRAADADRIVEELHSQRMTVHRSGGQSGREGSKS